MVYRGISGCRRIVFTHKTGMITAAALTSPRLEPSVTRVSGQPGYRLRDDVVTCGSVTKVTIYNCRN